MPDFEQPYLITFKQHGKTSWGYIAVAENYTLPFEIKRVYWTYATPETIIRGRHAHHQLKQILIAAAGSVIVKTEMPGNITKEFILNNPNTGVYIPATCWHTMTYTTGAVQIALANMEYIEADYIHDYEKFKNIK